MPIMSEGVVVIVDVHSWGLLKITMVLIRVCGLCVLTVTMVTSVDFVGTFVSSVYCWDCECIPFHSGGYVEVMESV